MLPIACKEKGIGAATGGPNPWGGGGGGVERRRTGPYMVIFNSYVKLPEATPC